MVLHQEKIEYALDSAAPVRPIEHKEPDEFDKDNAKVKHLDDAYNAQCIMLASMTMELKRQHEHLMPFEMLSHLKGLFENVSMSAEYDILRELFKQHMNDGGDVSAHVLKMIGLIERLAIVGVKFETKVSVNIIL